MLFGEIKFVFIAFISITAIIFYRVKLLSRNIIVCLFILIATLDLVVFNARFEDVVAVPPQREPFFQVRFPYKNIDKNLKAGMDLVNYRCDSLDKAGLNKNKNLIFQIPSFTGSASYRTMRFANFLGGFGYRKDATIIYPGDFPENDRFLDLSAVRYVFNNETEVTERPGALSRLSLFYSYKVIKYENRLFEMLNDGSFDPKNNVLLSREPEIAFLPRENNSSEFVPILNATSDEITAQVANKSPAILLFCESYSNGWKAYVDGEEVAIQPANYNFMSCAIRPGIHKVKFKFEPPIFFWAVKISTGGIIIFILGLIFLLFIPAQEIERNRNFGVNKR